MIRPMSRKRASLHTLGCRLNQAETLVLRDRLAAAGYDIVPFGDPADLAIINTCTVTREADAKCRQEIRGFTRANPAAYTAVIGCYSQMGAKALAAIPGVDLILGNHDKLAVLDHIGDGAKNDRPLIIRERISRDDFTVSFAGELPYAKRANLKIQDGCDFVCSFCIIPKARGPARARDFDNLLDEARSLAARGVRELVLTGVNLGLYDSGGRDITAVADALAATPGVERLRIGSIEPTTVPDSLLDRMADPAHPLLPFLHLPLQSGCDRILRDMRRRYTSAEYAAFARRALDRVPGLLLGTDVMVGFPGETDAEFTETAAFIADGPFDYAHVFVYSERDGTPAARRPDAVPDAVRRRRALDLRRISARKEHARLAAKVGLTVRVLFEDSRESAWPGYTDDYLRVVLHHDQLPGVPLANRTGFVRITRVAADFLEGDWAGFAE